MRVVRHVCPLLLLLLVAASPVGATCPPIDHSHAAWTAILQRWGRDGGMAYAALEREGRPRLTAYVEALSAACADDYRTWTRAQRVAFWINAYNAFTVTLVLDHYPITSIRRIGWLPGAAFRDDSTARSA